MTNFSQKELDRLNNLPLTAAALNLLCRAGEEHIVAATEVMDRLAKKGDSRLQGLDAQIDAVEAALEGGLQDALLGKAFDLTQKSNGEAWLMDANFPETLGQLRQRLQNTDYMQARFQEMGYNAELTTMLVGVYRDIGQNLIEKAELQLQQRSRIREI